ncbi:unnamed protein product [Nesidiocoris tenuis]|uniref:Uncharacterized protein n=1 Tax=Nesidiocoris tenuis TaxID=355587 RepID=A0A6H5G5G2_9HEMI|nr:unnamed protein product [Nesidiocoris tenuis]
MFPFPADDSKGLFSEQTFREHISPRLMSIFYVRDIQVRLTLLKYFPMFCDMFTIPQLNSNIIPELLVGVMDVNDELVASTLRALADLVPILGSATVIGGKRAKHFSDGRPKSKPPFQALAFRPVAKVVPGVPCRPQGEGWNCSRLLRWGKIGTIRRPEIDIFEEIRVANTSSRTRRNRAIHGFVRTKDKTRIGRSVQLSLQETERTQGMDLIHWNGARRDMQLRRRWPIASTSACTPGRMLTHCAPPGESARARVNLLYCLLPIRSPQCDQFVQLFPILLLEPGHQIKHVYIPPKWVRAK